MASVNNNPHNSINKTAAGKIAKKLDALDSKKNDGNIDKSVWDKFWEKNSDYGTAGKQESKVIQGDTQTINLQQATDLIMTRLFNKFKTENVNKKGAELLNKGNYELTTEKVEKKEEKKETEETEKFNNQTVNRDENKKPYIDNNSTRTYLKEYFDSDGKKQFITEEDFNKKIADAIGQNELPKGITAELNEKGEVVFKKEGRDISADDIKTIIAEQKKEAENARRVKEQKEIAQRKTNFETKHSNDKQAKRKIDGKKQEYYKYKDSSGNTVRSIIDENGKEQKLVIISDSPVTNKVFVTEDKLSQEIGQTTLPKWVDYATCDKDGKMVFVTQGGKRMTADKVKEKIQLDSQKAENKPLKAKKKEEKPNLTEIKLSELAQKTIDKFKAKPNVDLYQRIIDGKLQYYVIDNNGFRAVINNDGTTSPIVQIGRKKGKKVFVSLTKLQKAAEDAKIENTESLMKVPKGYECKVDEQGNVTLNKIQNKNKDKKDK